ncbi:hypothetical protein BDR05DRAFT_886448, partial [Suillus weaverae]
ESSFINAVRGLSNDNPDAARTGITECTNKVTRCPDPRQNSKIIWYDVAGAGTQNMPDWQYFNNLGLFDCIIVLIDIRFLESDLAILRTREQFTNVKAFIVRSKSDQHINNMAGDEMPGFDPCDPDVRVNDETRRRFREIKSEQQRIFQHNLSDWKVYIVCKDPTLTIWNNSDSSKAIDEAELLNDVKECVRRRPQSVC